MSPLSVVYPPQGGVWRVAPGPDPYTLHDPSPILSRARPTLEDAEIGHRFDSAQGDFNVRYWATELEGEYGEALAPLRPSPTVVEAVGDEDGYMAFGDVPREWRTHRVKVRATFERRAFIDVEAADTRAVLNRELDWVLGYVGIDKIDAPALRSRDRSLTRWIAQWVWRQRWEEGQPEYGGVRFTSRIEPHMELWAAFEDVLWYEEERGPISLQDDALQRVAARYGLTIH